MKTVLKTTEDKMKKSVAHLETEFAEIPLFAQKLEM